MYEEREYRSKMDPMDLVSFTTIVNETDLNISAKENLSEQAISSIKLYRNQIEDYIKENQEFAGSLEPCPIGKGVQPIINEMLKASHKAGVGPMAAVAGAMAKYVGTDLLAFSDDVIIENGGDLYIASTKPRSVMIYAGESPLSNKVGIEIIPEDTPIGICTSSGTVGHSLSFGNADAVMVLSKDVALADAVATATGNIIKSPEDITKAIDFVRSIPGIKGVLIVVEDKLGLWGDIRLIYP